MIFHFFRTSLSPILIKVIVQLGKSTFFHYHLKEASKGENWVFSSNWFYTFHVIVAARTFDYSWFLV